MYRIKETEKGWTVERREFKYNVLGLHFCKVWRPYVKSAGQETTWGQRPESLRNILYNYKIIMHRINKDKIIRVKGYGFMKSRDYSVVEFKAKKRWWQTEVEAGIYTKYGGLIDELPSNHVIKDGVIYEIPECRMHFGHNDYASKFFDTEDECMNFIKELTNDRKWLRM